MALTESTQALLSPRPGERVLNPFFFFCPARSACISQMSSEKQKGLSQPQNSCCTFRAECWGHCHSVLPSPAPGRSPPCSSCCWPSCRAPNPSLVTLPPAPLSAASTAPTAPSPTGVTTTAGETVWLCRSPTPPPPPPPRQSYVGEGGGWTTATLEGRWPPAQPSSPCPSPPGPQCP